MAKKTLAETSAELYQLLEPFDSTERQRIVKSVLVLLGEASDVRSDVRTPQTPQPSISGQQSLADASGGVPFDRARKYFNDKAPKGTSETLATAAMFFETHGGARVLVKDDFKAVFEGARRDFVASNFARDMDNAIKSGFFNAGGNAKKGYTLSGYGQDFLEALPDRTAAKAVQRPGRSGWKRASAGRLRRPSALPPLPVQVPEGRARKRHSRTS